MSTYLPPPLAMQQQPEEPPRFVGCINCRITVRFDEALLYKDYYYCNDCTTCGCGQLANSRCSACDSWTCEVCMEGEVCSACVKREVLNEAV